MLSRWFGIVALAVALLGVVAFRLSRPGEKARPVDPLTTVAARVDSLTSRLDTMEARQESEAETRQNELASVRASVAAQAPEPASGTSSADPPTAVEPPSSAGAMAVVDAAEQDGRWGPEQVRAFREATRGLPVEERGDAIRYLAVAVNSGKLHLAVHGMPL
jgi:hypothetical protein